MHLGVIRLFDRLKQGLVLALGLLLINIFAFFHTVVRFDLGDFSHEDGINEIFPCHRLHQLAQCLLSLH